MVFSLFRDSGKAFFCAVLALQLDVWSLKILQFLRLLFFSKMERNWFPLLEPSDLEQNSIFSLPLLKNLLDKNVSLQEHVMFLYENEKLKPGLLQSRSFRSTLASVSHHGKVRGYKHIIKPRAVTKKPWTKFPPRLRYCKFFASSGLCRVPKVSVLLQPDASFSRFMRIMFPVSSSLLQWVDMAAPSCDPDIARGSCMQVCRNEGGEGELEGEGTPAINGKTTEENNDVVARTVSKV